jgi:hypothetical protein
VSPGLTISSFISNGTDIILALPETIGGLSNRLVPSVANAASGQVAFRAITGLDAPSVRVGSISAAVTADWVRAGVVTHGSLDLDLFVFDVDANGRALVASPVAYRVELERTDE